MREQTKNIFIGLFLIVAIGLIVWTVMFLKPSIGDAKKTLYIRFSNINKIGVGTRVTFAGKPIGEVVAVEEILNPRAEKTDDEGRLYYYQLIVKYDSHYRIYTSDEIMVQVSGLLGEKSIAIIPRKPLPGEKAELITDQPVYADSADPIESTLSRVGKLAKKVDGTVEEIHEWFMENGPTISQALNNFGSAMEQVDTAVATMNQEHLIEEIKITAQNFTTTLLQIQDMVTQFENEGIIQNASQAFENIASVSQSIDVVASEIARGEGTIGKLIKKDDLYLQFSNVLSKVNTMMNDINHFGLLFHLNKGWQRTRTQRAVFLEGLETPEEFCNYFHNEVDEINTAMARLSVLIDKAESASNSQEIFQTTPFKRDFADLMREVDGLSDSLKLYNEKLQDMETNMWQGGCCK